MDELLEQPNTVYESVLITWSPKGENTTKSNIIRHTRHYVDHYLSFLDDITDRFEFNVELNMNGNIHFHGYVMYPQHRRRQWLTFLLHLKTKGFVKINKVRHNLNKAMEYCRKDRALMHTFLPSQYNPITYPISRQYTDIRHYLKSEDLLDEGLESTGIKQWEKDNKPL